MRAPVPQFASVELNMYVAHSATVSYCIELPFAEHSQSHGSVFEDERNMAIMMTIFGWFGTTAISCARSINARDAGSACLTLLHAPGEVHRVLQNAIYKWFRFAWFQMNLCRRHFLPVGKQTAFTSLSNEPDVLESHFFVLNVARGDFSKSSVRTLHVVSCEITNSQEKKRCANATRTAMAYAWLSAVTVCWHLAPTPTNIKWKNKNGKHIFTWWMQFDLALKHQTGTTLPLCIAYAQHIFRSSFFLLSFRCQTRALGIPYVPYGHPIRLMNE